MVAAGGEAGGEGEGVAEVRVAEILLHEVKTS